MPRAAKSYQYLNSTHVFLVLEFNQIQALSVDLREAIMARTTFVRLHTLYIRLYLMRSCNFRASL